MSHAKRLLVQSGWLALLALLGLVPPIAVFPACQRVTAPLLCPQETVRSVVVVSWTSPAPGESTMTSALVCIDGKERPQRVRNFHVVALIFGACFLALSGLVLFGRTLAALRGR
jgi:hypothetical protein